MLLYKLLQACMDSFENTLRVRAQLYVDFVERCFRIYSSVQPFIMHVVLLPFKLLMSRDPEAAKHVLG